MTFRQTETSREIRLWVTQVILPAVGMVLMVPEAREAAVTKAKELKDKIERKFKK
jgi:prophage antirepressor-like protein